MVQQKGEPDWNRHGRFRDKLADIILNHVDELIVFTSMAPIKDKGTRKAYEDAACARFMMPPNSGYAAGIPYISYLLGTPS